MSILIQQTIPNQQNNLPEQSFYEEEFDAYYQQKNSGQTNRIENGNENVGAIQPPATARINSPAYVSPQLFLDNVAVRYVIQP